jgi:predicted nucleotidyltransferase
MIQSVLNNQIIKTLEYFDVQDHPLTLLEVYKYLLKLGPQDSIADLMEVESSLSDLQSQRLILQDKGFYFLPGREALVKSRLENNYYSTARLNLAKKYLPGVRFVPFVSAIALTGSEAINNSKQGSDIDLLVLTEPNRIWTARLLLTAYFQILGVRRHSRYIENRFCLNHYIQESKVVDRERHIYTAVEYVSLLPFYGSDKIYQFQQLNLDWIKVHLAQPQIVKYPNRSKTYFKIVVEKILDNKFGNVIENLSGKFQKRRIHIQDSIVVENDELSFHPGNKGRKVLEKLPFKTF